MKVRRTKKLYFYNKQVSTSNFTGYNSFGYFFFSSFLPNANGIPTIRTSALL